LLEKERTTPEYYPLSLSGLITAINQKTGRNPVMQADQDQVLRALDSLKTMHLVWQRHEHGARVAKYDHDFNGIFQFSEKEVVVLALLFLRGASTPGEINSRSGRMYQFENIAEIEAVLQNLSQNPSGPFAQQLPKEPGKRERRWIHLFSKEKAPELLEPQSHPAAQESATEPPPPAAQSSLQEQIDELRRELAEVKAALDRFTSQFE